jgi:hypothetical protein
MRENKDIKQVDSIFSIVLFPLGRVDNFRRHHDLLFLQGEPSRQILGNKALTKSVSNASLEKRWLVSFSGHKQLSSG